MRRSKSSIGCVAVVLSLLASTTNSFTRPSTNYNNFRLVSFVSQNKWIRHQHLSEDTVQRQIIRPSTTLHAISPSAALSAVGSPLGSIAVLAFVILVHESGHFLAARSLGINVDEFSVGVGPRIVGVRRRLVDDKFVFEKINDATANDEEDVPRDDRRVRRGGRGGMRGGGLGDGRARR